MATLSEIRRNIQERLAVAVGSGEASAMARVIIEDVLKVTPVDMALNPNREVENELTLKVEEIVKRVAEGEPLQYVLGLADFHGLRLKVRPGVLIPRPETSQLVDIVLKEFAGRKDLYVIDVCSGSGAIAVALGRELPFCQIDAVDISPVAVEICKENCKYLGLRNINIMLRNILKEGLPAQKYDLIVSNPPYVDESEKDGMEPRVLNHEPHIALFVPDDNPLLFYRKIAEEARGCLKPGGMLYFEINPRHAEDIRKLLIRLDYEDVEIIRDSEARYRFAKAKFVN